MKLLFESWREFVNGSAPNEESNEDNPTIEPTEEDQYEESGDQTIPRLVTPESALYGEPPEVVNLSIEEIKDATLSELGERNTRSVQSYQISAMSTSQEPDSVLAKYVLIGDKIGKVIDASEEGIVVGDTTGSGRNLRAKWEEIRAYSYQSMPLEWWRSNKQ